VSKTYFVTGIGTGIGKTVTSAVLTEKLKADYWKPIQSGDLAQSDSLVIASLISNNNTKIHPETYRLTQPLSPHLSAKLDGIQIELNNFWLPVTANNLIIEGAGGIMVPLNNEHLIIDLIKKFDVEVILVSQNYLGSINHTLLSINLLKQSNIKIKGIIFNGESNPDTESYILNYSGINPVGRVPKLQQLNKEEILKAGDSLFL
jgi:dethiobiotin synthetase